ncbi:MAG: hypothetical protein H6737_03660 [Alphaproteobacteria bacterium]|nr:hypothetical protein [Alphaproteobacteria bacterium]
MIVLQLLTALAGTATLHVAVHRDAGTVYDVAADGADGQCVVLGTSWVACPASGPVTFRWGPRGDWAMEGQTVVGPGETGEAFVLAPDGSLAERRAQLQGEVTPELVRELFVRTGDRPIPPVTPGLFEDLVALAGHPDWKVRREVVRALVPYARHTASDPFPSDAPSLIPDGLIETLGRDDDRRVRRRVLALLVREMGPEDPRGEEAGELLRAGLEDPNPGVRRLSVVMMAKSAQEGGEIEPVEAWNAALARVPTPGAPGRAACNALAKLHDSVDMADVDADGTLALILQHHPERAWHYWAAWKRELPFDAARAERLLRDTVGLSQGLLREWAEEAPEQLAATVRRWEPAEPHSERFRVVAQWLDPKATDPGLRAALALDDRMSDPPGAPVPE